MRLLFTVLLLASRAAAQCAGETKLASMPAGVHDSRKQELDASGVPIINGYTYPSIQQAAATSIIYNCPSALPNTVMTVSVTNAGADIYGLWVATGVYCDPTKNSASPTNADGTPLDSSANAYPYGVGPNDGSFVSLPGDTAVGDVLPPISTAQTTAGLPFVLDQGQGTTTGLDSFVFSINNGNGATGPFCLWATCLEPASGAECVTAFSTSVAQGATLTPSATVTPSASPSVSGSDSSTGSASSTATPSLSASPSPTGTTSTTLTATSSSTETNGTTHSNSPFVSPSHTGTPTPTGTASPTGASTPSSTHTVSATTSLSRTRSPIPPSGSLSPTPGGAYRSGAILWRAAAVNKVYFSSPAEAMTLTVSNYTQSPLRVVFGCGTAVCDVATTNFYNKSGWALTPNNINLIVGSFAKDLIAGGPPTALSYTCYSPSRAICVAIQCNNMVGCPGFTYKLQTAIGAAAASKKWTPSRNQVIGGGLLLLLLLLLLLGFFFREKVRIALGCQRAPPAGSMVKRQGGSPVAFVPASGAPQMQNPIFGAQQAPQQYQQPQSYGGVVVVAAPAAVAAAPVAVAAPSDVLPPGWVVESDGTDTWYVNTATGESSWTLPTQ